MCICKFYFKASHIPDVCQLPVNRLRYPKGQSNADTVTGTILWTPYIRHLRGTADSPILPQCHYVDRLSDNWQKYVHCHPVLMHAL
jgi:hypothetical protein